MSYNLPNGVDVDQIGAGEDDRWCADCENLVCDCTCPNGEWNRGLDEAPGGRNEQDRAYEEWKGEHVDG